MIIDPKVKKDIEKGFFWNRKVIKDIDRGDLRKFVEFFVMAGKILDARDYESELITSMIKLQAKYGDVLLTEGLREFVEFLKGINYKLSSPLGEEETIRGFDLFFVQGTLPLPIMAGVYELIIACAICKPGEHRVAVYENSGRKFAYVFGRTQKGEVFIVKVGNSEFYKRYEEIQQAVEEEERLYSEMLKGLEI
jgi:hypothetical protein